jgi:hypothetical protein
MLVHPRALTLPLTLTLLNVRPDDHNLHNDLIFY